MLQSLLEAEGDYSWTHPTLLQLWQQKYHSGNNKKDKELPFKSNSSSIQFMEGTAQ